MLAEKKILLGVCGSIAAYKSALLIRLLIKAGADVQVIMTPAAADFITPLTLATLSKRPVAISSFDPKTGEWENHVELGLWADLFIIAPASANTLAKLAGGLCDNLLTAVYLSAKCPVYFAPAMDLDMWRHPSTLDNVGRLQAFGNHLIRPGDGELASGLSGEGRMAEPEEILALITADLKKELPLTGKKALVSAGPTYEAIDPVRFIGNHSSGKMGYAIAGELQKNGAEVTLVSGPVSLNAPTGIEMIPVTSAAEMLIVMESQFSKSDIIVMCAAVADFTPEKVADQKIKKTTGDLELKLKRTTDILSRLGNKKSGAQVLVGFALETEHEEEYAREKLHNKNLDLIVLNSLRDTGAGFKGDDNKITLIDRTMQTEHFELKSKISAAADICRKIINLIPHA